MTEPGFGTDGRDIDRLISDLEATLAQLRAVRDVERGTADLRARLDAIKRRRAFRVIRGGLAAIVGLGALTAWRRLLRAAYVHPVASVATTLAVGTVIGVGVTAGVGASMRNVPHRPSAAAPAVPQPTHSRHTSPHHGPTATPHPSASTILTPPQFAPPGLPGSPTVPAPTIPTPAVPVPTPGHGHGRTHTPLPGTGGAIGGPRRRRRRRGGGTGLRKNRPRACALDGLLGLLGLRVC